MIFLNPCWRPTSAICNRMLHPQDFLCPVFKSLPTAIVSFPQSQIQRQRALPDFVLGYTLSITVNLLNF
jgi:hypothetical protein